MTGDQQRSGEERLKEALQRRKQARKSDPEPYDDDWGWWIEKRLARLETGQRWIIGLAAGLLVAECARIAFNLLWGS